MILEKYKERLIGILLLVFGLQYIIIGVYNSINFDSLHIIPGMCYFIYPSPTDYYIPLTILGIVCLISGIMIFKEKKIKTYISNVALVGIAINLMSKLFIFNLSDIDSLVWVITGITASVISLIFLNYQGFRNKIQIGIKILIVIFGLFMIHIAPVFLLNI